MRAVCMIREALHYRRSAFVRGLTAAGYRLESRIISPQASDVLVIWNRYGWYDEEAKRFERAGARVVVCENGYLGKSWMDGDWFAMSIGHHNGAGAWVNAGNERWDSLNVPLQPWRGGDDVLILGQRGIGEDGIRSPDLWAEHTRAKLGVGRIRGHPGNEPPKVSLEQDLRGVGAVITWASSAALHALIHGIPVWYAMPKWIGRWAALPVAQFGEPAMRSDVARLQMFRSLVWAMWRLSEIESGEAFTRLLGIRDEVAA